MNKRPHQTGTKEQYWQETLREAARSGTSIRAFCLQQGVSEKQFYYWQRRLKQRHKSRLIRKRPDDVKPASFALVSENPRSITAGIELVLNDGRKLRISQGVDEETLRAVLSALERQGC